VSVAISHYFIARDSQMGVNFSILVNVIADRVDYLCRESPYLLLGEQSPYLCLGNSPKPETQLVCRSKKYD